MKGKKHKPGQIIGKLRRAETRLAEGATVSEVCRDLEVSEATYHRWKRRYGAMNEDQLKRLKALEKENARLKKIVADQAVDMSILKEAAEGNF
ncbi:MAG: transposase [Longimicrobiales bacterium]